MSIVLIVNLPLLSQAAEPDLDRIHLTHIHHSAVPSSGASTPENPPPSWK